MDEYEHDFVNKMLASKNAESLEWLRSAPEGSVRNLGEMEPEASMQLVLTLYKLGAAKILAVEIEEIPGREDQTTNHLLVQLPQDADARQRLFKFESEHAASKGFDGEPDRGQEYLYFMLC